MDIPMNIVESPRLERTKISLSQFGLMVDFITLNPELASRKASEKCDKAEFQKKWEQLAVLLNSDCTGPQKKVLKWRKSWADMKNNLKTKMEKLHSSGSVGQHLIKINDIEEKAWNLIKSEKMDDRKKILKSTVTSIKENIVPTNYFQEIADKNYIKLENNPSGVNSKTFVEKNYVALNLNDCPSGVNAAVASVSNVLAKPEFGSNSFEIENRNNSLIRSNSLKCLEESSILETASNATMDSETKCHSISKSILSANLEKNVQNNGFELAQNSSTFSLKKGLKVQNYNPLEEIWQETEVIPLLQKQIELLENIAQSTTRMEIYIEANLSKHI